jgi:tetratricopeptide (TPR) repeat protein
MHGDGVGSHLAELAHHSIVGRDFENGVRYARLAGDWALTLLAFEEAARLFRASLAALDSWGVDDRRARCELLLSLGEALARAGDIPAAKAAFLAAAETARELGAARELALAAFGYGGRSMYGRAGDDELLVPLLEEALRALDDDEPALRARLSARLAGALRDEPSREGRDRLSREAIELARRTGDLAALAYALDGRAAAMMAPDTVRECLELATELRDVARTIGDRERVAHGLLHRLIAQIMLGELVGAAADLAAMRRLADALKQPSELWQVASAEAMLALAEGRLAEAEKLIATAFSFGERGEPAMAIPVHRLQRYTLYDFLGQLEEVEQEIHELVAEYPARVALRCTLAHLAARLGRKEEATCLLGQLVRDDLVALQFDNEWLFGVSLLAETCALVGDADSAALLYRRLLPWGSLIVLDHPEVVRGSVARYLGLLAATHGHLEEASAHFEAALATNARLHLRPWLAHTQADYGRMLLEWDDGVERESAHEFLRRALAAYRQLGMLTHALAVEATTGPRAGLRLVEGSQS